MDVNGYAGIGSPPTTAAQPTAATKEAGYVTGKDIGGRTVGEPKLSEAGKKLYDELRKKYGDMDFVLVSKDQKDFAKANAASYARSDKTTVLIDEEKIEKMAADENYRKQVEGQIDNAKKQLPQLEQAIAASGGGVAGFGLQINDNGTVSFFAAMEKSNAEQMERLAEKRVAKRQERKEAEKKAQKEALEERIESRRTNDAEPKGKEKIGRDDKNVKDYDMISAGSIEELIRKVEDYNFAKLSDNVLSENEKYIGGSIDFKG